MYNYTGLHLNTFFNKWNFFTNFRLVFYADYEYEMRFSKLAQLFFYLPFKNIHTFSINMKKNI